MLYELVLSFRLMVGFYYIINVCWEVNPAGSLKLDYLKEITGAFKIITPSSSKNIQLVVVISC